MTTTATPTANSQRHELYVVHALSGKLDVDEAWNAAWFFYVYGDPLDANHRVEVKRFNTEKEMKEWLYNTRLHPSQSIPFYVSELRQYSPPDADEYEAELDLASVTERNRSEML